MVRVHFGPPTKGNRPKDRMAMAAIAFPQKSESILAHHFIQGRENGGLAQLGERLPCKQEVSGSIPLISTTKTRDWKKLQRRLKFPWVSLRFNSRTQPIKSPTKWVLIGEEKRRSEAQFSANAKAIDGNEAKRMPISTKMHLENWTVWNYDVIMRRQQ